MKVNRFFQDKSGVLIPALLILAMLIFPLPALLLDILMALFLIFAFFVLFVTLNPKRKGEFSSLPIFLLVMSAFNLAVQFSFIRLILTQGEAFNGRIIRALSSLWAGSDGIAGVAAGFAVFVAFTAAMAVVAVKGTGRVAEVAARFCLDAMPGKQMALDSEFSHGIISEKERLAKLDDLQKESDFLGALDGAGKFISGNFKVSILITIISIIVGIVLGVVYNGETLRNSARKYVPLSISNGFLVQFLVLLECLTMIVCFNRHRRSFVSEKHSEASTEISPATSLSAAPLATDPLTLQIGFGLIPLVDEDKWTELLKQIQDMRNRLADEAGIVIPKIRIIDNVMLSAYEYCILVNGKEVGRKVLCGGCKNKETTGSVSVIIDHLSEVIRQYAVEISV